MNEVDWDKVPGGEPKPLPAWLKWGLATVAVIGAASLVIMGSLLSDGDDTASGAPADAPERTRVTYRVTTSLGSHPVSLTYENATGNTEQRDVRTRNTEWDMTFTPEPGQFLYISAQNGLSHGTVECEIVLNGDVVEQARSDGGYVIATCSTRAPR